MIKKLVYIASPYTKGDPILNVRASILMMNEMILDDVVIPISPLSSAFAHMLTPIHYENWMRYDLDLITRCDAILRIDAVVNMEDGTDQYFQHESSGADREVAHAEALDIPVFYCKSSLYNWIDPPADPPEDLRCESVH